MGPVFVIGVAAMYLGAAGTYACERDYARAVMWACYAMANIAILNIR